MNNPELETIDNAALYSSRDQFIAELLKLYCPVKVFSDKPEKRVILLEHRIIKKRFVLRSYSEEVPIYRFLCGISAEHLPRVYDCFRLPDGEVVLEEYIKGISIGEMLEVKLYTYSEAKKIIADLCEALSFLHKHNFVHRDIKPENVMISDEGVCKLIDFDATRHIEPGKSNDTTFLGTVGYASPEQYGIAQSDSRSDIYALGVLLNIMLTGVHPSERLAKGSAGKIVLRCTMINPKKRFKSVERLAAAL